MNAWTKKCRDPRWQKIRLGILERDNWRCVICCDQKCNLQVHHVYYKKGFTNPWDYEDESLQTLCEECHEERQELIDNAANTFKMMLRKIPTGRIMLMAKRMMEEVRTSV